MRLDCCWIRRFNGVRSFWWLVRVRYMLTLFYDTSFKHGWNVCVCVLVCLCETVHVASSSFWLFSKLSHINSICVVNLMRRWSISRFQTKFSVLICSRKCFSCSLACISLFIFLFISLEQRVFSSVFLCLFAWCFSSCLFFF